MWWVTFTDRKGGCIDHGSKEEARKVAEQYGTVEEINILPYPASPRLEPVTAKDFPSFCYTPGQCKGKSSCPRNYSCVD